MDKKLLALLICLSGLLSGINAQHISVNSILLNNPLPSNSVRRIFQDKNGFIWFGTLDGLCRYDGYRVITFRSDFNNPELLTNNEITCITEDKNNNLWIGTRKGINILDEKSYNIKHFNNSQVKDSEIKWIVVSSDGNIWVGADNSVYCYYPDFTFKRKYDDILPVNANPNNIYEDSSGNIWLLLWGNGLYKYDKDSDSFIKFPKIGERNIPFRILEDNQKRYWICTWGDGLYLFDPGKNEHEMYTKIPTYNKERGLAENTFYSIVQDDKYNYIWAMSFSGLYVFKDQPNKTFEQVDISHLFKIHNNIFSEIIKDRTGNLWIGTFSEGVLIISFNKPVIQNYNLSSIKEQTGITPNITTMFTDHDGDIWFNQNRWGMGVFNAKKNKVQFYDKLNPFLSKSENSSIISCISEFRSVPGEIWVGIENSPLIYCVKKKDQQISLIKSIDLSETISYPGNPRLMFEDRQNNILIATSSGLFIKPYLQEEIRSIDLHIETISGITEDTKGEIWISSENQGVFQIPVSGTFNIDKYKIINYSKDSGNLTSNNISSICADKNGQVWIGSKEGSVVVYDVNSKKIEDLTRSIRLTGESILNIVDDDYENIWISTNKQITVYNPRSRATRVYSETDGVLVNSFLKNSCYKDRMGKIYFGGNKGITVFNPSEDLFSHIQNNHPLITDIKINSQSVFQSNNNNKFDIGAQKLTIAPDDKNIEIDFSSLNYTFPSKIRYAYKMENVDQEWIYPEGNRQFAIYSQLSKGSHRFFVKATDENGLWNNKETVMEIYKQPAFYETWWAYVIYAIITFTIISFIIIFAKNRIKLINKLKIAQIEKNKSEELTQTKLRYFTNISHDFLTPLTIISCLIDDAEITYSGKIKQFDAIRLNLSRLRRLLQQVLDFRKVESGNMKLKITQGDIAGFIKDLCYNHFLILMKKKNINFLFSSNPSQIHAYFDADKIDKIVFNLLSNAFKYTPDGGQVKIELERHIMGQHTFLRICVSDTGIGISPESIQHIFTRFYSSKMKEAAETNGIGLNLTKELTEIHHGTIDVKSAKDSGTIFTIEIPIDRESYNDSEHGIFEHGMLQEKNMELLTIPDDIEFETNENTQGSKTAILLVEDNVELLILMKNILSKHYHIITSVNGIDALEKVKESNVDIIISDVMMPELDGLDLCRILKNDLETSHILIILLTAKNSTEDRIECYNAGADAYISKPFDLKVLEARINNFLVNKKNKQKEFKKNIEIDISTLEYPSLDEQFLNNAVKIIEENLAMEAFDVVTLADKLNMSKSSLYRKIKSMTDLSPRDFIRNIRLKHACMMLKDKSIPVSEVAYSVGFSDPKYFATCFRQEFDITPSNYQKGN